MRLSSYDACIRVGSISGLSVLDNVVPSIKSESTVTAGVSVCSRARAIDKTLFTTLQIVFININLYSVVLKEVENYTS